MGIQTRRAAMNPGSPNVAFASGDIYPNGVDINPANADVQATVRPGGWLFHPSAGFRSVVPGKHQVDQSHPHGDGIHFTPLRLAEDLSKQDARGGPPVMVDPASASKTVDIADVPGSEYLDDEGKLPGYLASQNRGPYMLDGTNRGPTNDPASGANTLRDMGDRSPLRPLTRAFYGLAQNPAGMLRAEWQDSPVIAVAWAAGLLGVVYLFADNVERAFKGRGGGRGVAATAGAAPAAAAEGTGKTVKQTTEVANKALTEAGEAVETAVSAAGDAVEAAGTAVEKTTEAAADAVKAD